MMMMMLAMMMMILIFVWMLSSTWQIVYSIHGELSGHENHPYFDNIIFHFHNINPNFEDIDQHVATSRHWQWLPLHCNCNSNFVDINPDESNTSNLILVLPTMLKNDANLDKLTFCISTATPILLTSKKMMMRAARLSRFFVQRVVWHSFQYPLSNIG